MAAKKRGDIDSQKKPLRGVSRGGVGPLVLRRVGARRGTTRGEVEKILLEAPALGI